MTHSLNNKYMILEKNNINFGDWKQSHEDAAFDPFSGFSGSARANGINFKVQFVM